MDRITDHKNIIKLLRSPAMSESLPAYSKESDCTGMTKIRLLTKTAIESFLKRVKGGTLDLSNTDLTNYDVLVLSRLDMPANIRKFNFDNTKVNIHSDGALALVSRTETISLNMGRDGLNPRERLKSRSVEVQEKLNSFAPAA